MHAHQHALRAGSAVPENGDVLHRATGQDVWDNESSNDPDSDGATAAAQALEHVAGEAEAHAYLRRVDAGCSRPGELLLLLSELEGHERRGAARVIEKALEARHG